MNEPANFHSIESTDDLPSKGRCSATNICVDNEFQAQQYALKYPERQIYWIAEMQKGIWYQLLRRTSDLSKSKWILR